jgi:hypothetical protein
MRRASGCPIYAGPEAKERKTKTAMPTRKSLKRLRQDAEDTAAAFEAGLTSRREALAAVGDLEALWVRLQEQNPANREAAVEFWAWFHRAFDLLRFPETDRIRIWSQAGRTLPNVLWKQRYRPKAPTPADEARSLDDAEEIAAAMTEAGYALRDTGGGFHAWEKDVSAGWFLRITAGEDRAFGDADEAIWWVGLWDRARGWVWDFFGEPDDPRGVIDFEPEVIGLGPMDMDDALETGEILAKGLAAQVSRELDHKDGGEPSPFPRVTPDEPGEQ